MHQSVQEKVGYDGNRYDRGRHAAVRQHPRDGTNNGRPDQVRHKPVRPRKLEQQVVPGRVVRRNRASLPTSEHQPAEQEIRQQGREDQPARVEPLIGLLQRQTNRNVSDSDGPFSCWYIVSETASPWRTSHVLFYTSRMNEFLPGLLISQDTVRLVAGIGAVLLIVVIILRRKGKKKPAEDEF